MLKLILLMTIAGIASLIGFAVGSALTGGDWLPAILFAGVGFALGLALGMLIITKAAQDEHPTTSR